MEKWYQWMKQIVFCMVFLELLAQMVQGKEYQRYLKFVGGLILILTALGPLLQMFRLSENLEDRMMQWEIREEAVQTREAEQELKQLQRVQIEAAYKSEIEKEMRSIANAYGTEVEKLEISFKEEGKEVDRIDVVEMELTDTSEKENIIRTMGICLGLEKEQIRITEKSE